MSLLTKIFVVLDTVLALALVPLVIAYVHNTDHLASELAGQRQMMVAAEESAAIANQQLADAHQARADAVEQAETAKARLRGRVTDLQGQLEARDLDLIETRNQLAQAQAQADQLSAGLEQNAQLLTMLEEEVRRRRDESIEARQRIAELNDALQDKSTQLVTALENIRLMREKLVDTEQMLADAREGGDDRDETESRMSATPVDIDYPIYGNVTGVQEAGEGNTFVAIDLGSNDNVSEGMQFIVHEGTNYLGTIELRTVDLNESVGVLVQRKNSASIRPDQQVTYTDF